MPKIIKNLDEKIYNAAMKLFSQYGYEGTDMKKISKEIGVAVGTLYNYYPNKEELFLNVIEQSWKITFEKIEDICNMDDMPRNKLVKFVQVLAEETADRKGIGRTVMRENLITEDGMKRMVNLRNNLLNKMESLIGEYRENNNLKFEKRMDRRLSETIFITIVTILAEHPDEKDINLEFFNQFIDTIF